MLKENDWKQKSLLPKLLEEGDASYQAVIDLQEALSDEKNCNIALTGPFGAGKSSVILTLLEKEKDNFCFLPISLATLDAVDENNSKTNTNRNKKDNETLNRRIEYSILQQLIYKEKYETLPYSRLKKIPHLSNDTIIKFANSIIAFVLCFCIVFEPQWLKIDILYQILDFGYWGNGICDLIALCIMIYIFYKFLIAAIKRYGCAKLNHIKIAGGEIQIKDENSIFNHHLDEILYFFQCTSYNVVIIEDLDRFNTTDIFLKLRELNFLLNHSQIVNRKIRFVYAIKDDMFTDSSRTKFFDYITTVIPVISPYNSKEILRNALIDLGHGEEVDNSTIKEVAFFIDDMRLLQNIVNEYHQYRLRLGCGDNHKIDNNKLLAMIVYKNYHPRDFALLPARDGKIYSALCQENKRKCVAVAVEGLQKRKDAIRRKREVYNATKHLQEIELRKIYVFAYLTKMNASIHYSYRVNSICVDSIYHPISDCWDSEDTFNKLIIQNSIKYKYNGNSSNGTLNVNFSEIEKEIDSTMTFQDRLDALVLGEEEISKEEDSIKMEESLITSYPMYKLINRYSLYNEAFYKKLKLPDMADRFIRIGLIAEDYYDYISYFYEGMVSAKDHSLILDMKLDRKPDYRIHIDNVKTFLEEIPDDVFLTQSIYNIDLLDYLAIHKEEHIKLYDLFIYQLINDKSFDFVTNYYKEGKETSTVLTYYIHSNPQKMWKSITRESNQYTMLEIWFRYCTIEHIKETQIRWINTHYEFISSIYLKLQDDKMKYLVNNVKYNKLVDDSSEMIGLIIKNNCYEISTENMPIIVKYKKAYNDITMLNNDEQKLAIQLNLLNPNWKNISLYFKSNDNFINEDLWKFIENNAEVIGDFIYEEDIETENLLFKQLMDSNNLSYDAYQHISSSFDKKIYDLDEGVKQLEEKRLCWLIKSHHIEYSEDNISIVNDLSEQVKYEFIVYNKSHFVNDIDKYTYNEVLALKILQSSEFNFDEKTLLLTRLNSSNVTMTSSLADSICSILKIKAVDFDYILLKKALKQATDREDVLRISILTIGNNKTNDTVITELLQLMGNQYSKIAEKGKRPIIEDNSLNKLLLDVLVECNYISSYSKEDKGYRINTRQKQLNS